MSKFSLFTCDQITECFTAAIDPDHAKNQLRKHYSRDGDTELTVTALPLDEVMDGWTRFDQWREENVYVSPSPTVAQILNGDEALKLEAITGPCVILEVDDALFDTDDGMPPETDPTAS